MTTLPCQRHKQAILTLLNNMVTLLLFSYFSFQKKILPLPRAIRTEDMNQQANIVTSLPINKLEEVYHLHWTHLYLKSASSVKIFTTLCFNDLILSTTKEINLIYIESLILGSNNRSIYLGILVQMYSSREISFTPKS